MDIIERLETVLAGGLDSWPIASMEWEYAEAIKELKQLTTERDRLSEECRDFAAQAETDAGIIKADGKAIHFLREENARLRTAAERLLSRKRPGAKEDDPRLILEIDCMNLDEALKGQP